MTPRKNGMPSGTLVVVNEPHYCGRFLFTISDQPSGRCNFLDPFLPCDTWSPIMGCVCAIWNPASCAIRSDKGPLVPQSLPITVVGFTGDWHDALRVNLESVMRVPVKPFR